MADQANDTDTSKPEDKEIGNAQGGADSSGSGNILAGVQPDEKKDEKQERRDD